MSIEDCPFCESIDTQVMSQDGRVNIVCVDCEARGPIVLVSDYGKLLNWKIITERKAIALWNYRSTRV